MTALEMLEALVPNPEQLEDRGAALIEVCEADFRAECCRDDVPDGAAALIARMALHRFGQLDGAGLQSQSYSGASESYMSDYPEDLKRAMHRFRKLRML